MDFIDRMKRMGADLGMSLNDVRRKLRTSRSTSYRIISDGQKPHRFSEVFGYFEDKHDLHWLEFGGVIDFSKVREASTATS